MVHGDIDLRGWVTTVEAAKMLGVDRSTVRKWYDRGYLRGWTMPTGARRIEKKSIDMLLKGMKRD